MVWDICGCAVVKLQTHYMVLLTRCPLISNLSQHALTPFQCGIIPPSSSVGLLCSPLSICLHFSSTSPNWFHANTLHSCCLTPAFLSFPGLLSKSIFTLLSFTFCFVTLCSHRHLWLWLNEPYDLSACTCVSQQRCLAMLMNCLHGL